MCLYCFKRFVIIRPFPLFGMFLIKFLKMRKSISKNAVTESFNICIFILDKRIIQLIYQLTIETFRSNDTVSNADPNSISI